MGELQQITGKYNPDYVREGLESLDSLKRFSLVFFKDVAEIYDCLTRLKNVERNPSGFSLDDAPILGLLVPITKLVKREGKRRDHWVPGPADPRSLDYCNLSDAPRPGCHARLSQMLLQGPAAH